MEFPDIDPVALAIGPLVIRWYALAYLAGFLLGWWYALKLVQHYTQHKITKAHIDDFLTWAVIGVIAGGRLGYVLFYNFEAYMNNPLSAFKVWEGGMSFHGGALGVIAALILFSWRKKIYVLRLSDIVCACVPIGLFFGRIANFINGELFGRVTDGPWGVVFPRGGDLPRHPSQLYEAALEGALLFIVLFVLMRSKSVREIPGIVSGLFLCGYGLSRFMVEYVREPDAHIGLLGGFISMGQILSLPMVVFGLGVIMYAFFHKPKGAA